MYAVYAQWDNECRLCVSYMLCGVMMAKKYISYVVLNEVELNST